MIRCVDAFSKRLTHPEEQRRAALSQPAVRRLLHPVGAVSGWLESFSRVRPDGARETAAEPRQSNVVESPPTPPGATGHDVASSVAPRYGRGIREKGHEAIRTTAELARGVACPTCGAGAGDYCHRDHSHAARHEAAVGAGAMRMGGPQDHAGGHTPEMPPYPEKGAS